MLAVGSSHSYAVTSTDTTNVTGAMSAALHFTVDTSAPGQPAAPGDAGVSNGVVNAAHDTAGQTIGGTAEAGASVAVYDNGTQVATVVADGAGAWSLPGRGPGRRVGAQFAVVTATDAAGNTSAMSTALSFTVEASGPAQPGAPADGAVSNGYVNAAHDTAWPDHRRARPTAGYKVGHDLRHRDPGGHGARRRRGGLELPGRRLGRRVRAQLRGHRDRRGRQHQRDGRCPELHRRHQRAGPAGRADGWRGRQRPRQRRPRHGGPDNQRDDRGGRFGGHLR